MNLYDKVRNAECEIPESFDLKISQAEELIHNADPQDRYDLVCTAFKFGYMQGCRLSKQTKRTESEAERLRRYIYDMVGQIGSEGRLRRIYNIVHSNFLDDGLEVLNERQD